MNQHAVATVLASMASLWEGPYKTAPYFTGWFPATRHFGPEASQLNGEILAIQMSGPCELLVVSLGASKEQTEAVRQLAMAAPDVLAALVTCRATLLANGGCTAAERDAAVAKANAAIARAAVPEGVA